MEDLKNQIINKAGFLIYTDYWEKYFSKMTGEQVKEVFKIIFHFNLTFEVLKTSDLAIEMVVTTIIDNIKRDASKRAKQAIASAENGKKGGRGKKKEIPTNVGTNGVTKTIKQQNIENNFNEFWNFYTPVCAKDGTYTNKGSKQKAFKSYIKARNKFDHNKIMDCLKLYLEDCQKRGGYTKHVVSWLNSTIEDNFEYEQVIPIQSQVKPIFQTQEQRDQEIYTNFLKKHGGING
jgi:hypothetical protein